MSDLPWPPLGQHIIQFCIASDQLEPNYIAAMQWRPRQVCILSSALPRIIAAAKRLQAAFHHAGIPAEVLDIPDGEPAKLRDFAKQLVVAMRELDQDVHLMLNATGGKKVMSMAFAQAFEQAGHASVIYVDSEQRQIYTLFPHHAGSFPIEEDLITIDAALALRGFVKCSSASDLKEWRDAATARSALSHQLLQQSDALRHFLRYMNRAAAETQDIAQGAQLLRDREWLNPTEQAMLQALNTRQLASYDSTRQTIHFASQEARRYLGGQWLEEYTWLAVRKFAHADHSQCSLKVASQDKRAMDNEVDVLLAAENRLLIVECKTGNLSYGDKGNDALYRLDWLKQHLGGYYADTILLSLRPLDTPVAQRAQEMRALVLTGHQILHLETLVSRWLKRESYESLNSWIHTLGAP